MCIDHEGVENKAKPGDDFLWFVIIITIISIINVIIIIGIIVVIVYGIYVSVGFIVTIIIHLSGEATLTNTGEMIM